MRILGFVCLFVLAAGCMGPTTGTTTPSAGTSPATNGPSSTSAITTAPQPAQPIHLFFDFGGETVGSGDLSGWDIKAQVPEDPNNPGHPVSWNVTACDQQGWEGHVHIQGHPVHSACFSIDGRQDDGTVWLSRAIPITRGAAYKANVSVRAHGQESFNTIADIVLRLGVTGAKAEADFSQSVEGQHAAIRRPLDLAEGWTQYGMTWDTGPLATDSLVLDIGISVVWETQMTRYLDAVTVDLVPT